MPEHVPIPSPSVSAPPPLHRRRRGFALAALMAVALVVPVGLCGLAVAAPASATVQAATRPAPMSGATDRDRGRDKYSPRGTFTANWTRAQALKISADRSNTKPIVPANFPVMTDEVWVWDTWPLTDLDMKPLSYKGWNVIFSLTAPRDIGFGDRHWQAKIGYFYSRDARNWTYGGALFPEGESFGSREWAGSSVHIRGNTVQTFYTASGRDDGGIDPSDAFQRLATATTKIHADRDRVWFTGGRDHKIIAEAEGSLYQTLEQSQAGPIIYAFRDPFVFRDPKDKKVYALFEGNNPGVAGTNRCDAKEIGPVPAGHVVPADARYYTGNIGLMEATSSNLRNWRLLTPVLSAECTNQQTERPHLVVKDGQYYLWTISHTFTFAPGLTGPDGLYGFVGKSLRSDYKALNGSALVMGNPASAPLMTYSDYVMPNLLVESFIDTIPAVGGGVLFGGTLAPTVQLRLDGDRSRVVRPLGYGYIPEMRNVGGRVGRR